MVAKAGAMAEPRSGAKVRFYRPELDALRFVAFGLVFLHHLLPREVGMLVKHMPLARAKVVVTIVNAFGFGLSLFFFSSAFLITDLLLLELDSKGTISVRDFFIRRTFRIWPLYLFGLAIGVAYLLLLQWFRAPVASGSWLMMGMYVIMIGNWFYAMGGRVWLDNPITPLWSISVEEQFYGIWPWLVKAPGRPGVLWGSGAMLVAAIAVEFGLGQAHADRDTTIWTNTFVGFEFFAGGALTALWLQGRTFRSTSTRSAALLCFAAVMWFMANEVFETKAMGPAQDGISLVGGYFLITLGACALLLAFYGKVGLPPVLIRLGRISYGLYVFHSLALNIAERLVDRLLPHHIPVLILFARGGIALMITVGLAEFSYRSLETPFLRIRADFDRYESDCDSLRRRFLIQNPCW
jgi:peptidoglycan/LPS O-acetylase OafA/YrhL